MKMDEYETELLEAVNSTTEFEQVENLEDELIEAKKAAKNFIHKRENINISIPEFDLMILKRKSAELNIPYQTILSSLIHQYVTEKLKPTL